MTKERIIELLDEQNWKMDENQYEDWTEKGSGIAEKTFNRENKNSNLSYQEWKEEMAVRGLLDGWLLFEL